MRKIFEVHCPLNDNNGCFSGAVQQYLKLADQALPTQGNDDFSLVFTLKLLDTAEFRSMGLLFQYAVNSNNATSEGLYILHGPTKTQITAVFYSGKPRQLFQ